MKILQSRFWGIGLSVAMLSGFAFAGNENAPRKTKRQDSIQIRAVAWGPTQADIDAAKMRAAQSSVVQNELKGAKYRQVAFEYVEEGGTDKSLPTPPPTRFRVIYYDYTNDQAIIAEGDFRGKEAITVRRESYDPGVGGDELDAAFELVKKDAEFESLAAQNKLEIYGAMPPVSNLNGERLVNVGVRNLDTGENKILGISFKNERVIRYENNAPPTAKAAPEACGITSAGQGSTGPGVAGQSQLTVTHNGQTSWEMLVVRPSASSGASNERSGIEIRDVKFRGKSVMKRGHAPILNVQYINNVCGPFRDWQYAEGFFSAPSAGATDPAPGIRVLADGQVATTSVETRNDAGNFQGVAIYKQDVGYGQEVVLVTEMNAGWYRYIMEWRFAPDGTIRPRYGFGSTTNSCVCAPRNHHVYWRFDFDIVQANNQIFQVERGRKFLRPITTESAVLRDYQFNRGFLVQNANGNEAYQITPGLNDGSVTNAQGILTDTYGGGDFWLMQFKGTAAAPNELDDPNSGSAANLAPWVNGESLNNQDLVVWYSAHQYRVDDASLTGNRQNIISGVHVIGPDLRPVRW